MKPENDSPAIAAAARSARHLPQWMQDEVALCDLDLVNPPRVILDIGANVGAYALRCAELWPQAEIHAFEPVADNFDTLAANTSLHGNIVCHRFAVRAKAGPSRILFGDSDTVHSFIATARSTGESAVVECLAATDLPAADLIKIDAEGLEVEILLHLELEHVTALVIEFHSAADREFIREHCRSRGFELVAEYAQHNTDNGQLKFARPGTYIPAASTPTPTASKRLFLALPLVGNTPPWTVHSILCLINSAVVLAKIQLNGDDASVGMARDALTAQFLKSDCTHLLFVDSDLIFTPQDVERIASHDVPVVGGLYPIKSEGPLKWCGNTFPEAAVPHSAIPAPRLHGEQPTAPNGLQRVRYLGTGFLCIAREVIERIIDEDRAEIEYTHDIPPHETRWNFWRMGVRPTDDARRRFLTEDWFFCQRCLELGIPVYADTKVRLRHIGTAVWPLQSQLISPSEIVNPQS